MTKLKDTKEKKIHIYATGLVHCSVCVPTEMTKDEIEQAVNLESPTGIDSNWKISKDKQFPNGGSNPMQCEQDSNRKHYLMNC